MYKLYDFDVRGLGEPIRLLFIYNDVPFEDIRAPCDSIDSKLPSEIKEKCPWGDVPLLEIVEDGKVKRIAQSLAIGRYLANKFGMTGSNQFEAALCDEYVDSCAEFFQALWPLYDESDQTKSKEIEAKVKETVHSKYLSKFERILQENNQTGNWLVGDKATWADIQLAHRLNDAQLSHGINFLQDDEKKEIYPALSILYNNIYSKPQIKHWVESRPITTF